MKRRLSTLIAATAALLSVACSKSTEESVSTPSQETTVEAGYGRLSLELNSKFDITVEAKATRAESQSTYEIPSELLPNVEELPLVITGKYADVDNDMVMTDYYQEFTNVSTYNTMEADKAGNPVPPYLAAGDYEVTVKNDGVYGVVSATNARFAGSHKFTIVARDEDDTATINISLQNSIIALDATEAFQKYFAHGDGAYLVVSDAEGTTLIEYTYSLDSGLVASTADEILFLEANTDLYLEGWGYRQATTVDGRYVKETFAKQKIGTTAQCTMNLITVDAENTGETSINITFEDSIVKTTTSDEELNQWYE